MSMRLSGLMSGMDTESIIEQLVMAKRTKVDNAVKAQKKLQWTQDAWKTLNAKIKKFYDGALSNMRFEGSFLKKTTKVSNSSVVSVITGENAMNSVQTLKVKQLAQSAYLTGGQVGVGEDKGKLGLTTDSRMREIGWDFDAQGTIKVTVGGEEKFISVNGFTTIGDLVQAFRDTGLNASFDTTNQRFYITSKGTGTESDFTISSADYTGMGMLQSLGLYYEESSVKSNLEKVANMTQEQIKEIVDGVLQSSLDSRLEELKAKNADLVNQKNELTDQVEALKEQYGTTLGLDGVSDLEKIKERVEALENKASEEGPLSEEEQKELDDLISLGKGLTSLADIQKELDEIEKNLDLEKGELTEEGKKNVEDALRKEIELEIQRAQDQLDVIAKVGAVKNDATDAVIELNGVEYTGSRNTFEINGLTLTVNSTTSGNETVTLTTQDDTDGIYDMIKNFFKEYNELINEMDKLYNAEPSKGYEPLTDDEKDAMSDREIEEWETKIKDSLLRRDDTLGTISSALKQMMLSGVTVNGKQMFLSNFGIETLGYFTAADNEKNAYHIDGDPDDPNTSGNADKLKAMIASDPQKVIDFFVGLSRNMYTDLTERMAKTDFSSSYTIYEDVRMKQEYDSYTQKIKELEAKLADYEDKWYSKFAKMETALSKLQSNVSAVTALLGG